MEELYVEGLATHGDPESCVDVPRGRGEALTGARAGRAIEPRNESIGVPTLSKRRKATLLAALSRVVGGPRAVEEPWHVRNLQAREPGDPTLARPADHWVGRSGNTDSKPPSGLSAGFEASSALGRVREVARRDKDARFTALLHHVTLFRLREAYWAISPKAAPGVDGVTWAEYGQDREVNLQDLLGRVQSGRYRATPSRRVYIPKADGRLRPLGIASLEDKIVQRAVAEVLNAVYEVDFRGFSYGFRPGRGPHDALDALTVGIQSRRVNWVLDADIRNFFGQIDHSWLRRFVEHLIADKRIWRLIGKWLAAGVIEDGEWTACEEGSPQGASISPLLANLYLHHVFDLWVDWWRHHRAHGDVIVVRFADDTIVGFQYEGDARRFLDELR